MTLIQQLAHGRGKKGGDKPPQSERRVDKRARPAELLLHGQNKDTDGPALSGKGESRDQCHANDHPAVEKWEASRPGAPEDSGHPGQDTSGSVSAVARGLPACPSAW